MSVDDRVLERLRAQIDALADEQVAGVVNEAVVEARARVRGILIEAIAERMLDRAEQELELGADESSVVRRAHGPRSSAAAGSAAQAPRERSGTPGRDVARGPDAADDAASGAARRSAAGFDREPDAGADAFYLYGIVGDDYEPEEIVGLDGRDLLCTITGEGMAALASRVPLGEFGEQALEERVGDLAWLEQTGRRHEEILEHVRERTTLVPMRLCTIYETEQSIREMLSREHEFLADALARLAGRTEWGVKIFIDSDAGAEREDARGAPSDADDEQGGPGERYLRTQQLKGRERANVEESVRERCTRVHERLCAIAVEAKINSLQPAELTGRSEQMVFNGVYLVEDSELEALESALRELHDELAGGGLAIELTGPWPPYNFVNSPTEVGR